MPEGLYLRRCRKGFASARIPSLMLAMLAAAVALAQGGAPMDFSQETRAQRDARMKWFREARFGMFIHWGLYAIPAGVWKGQNHAGAAEWLMFTAKIPVADYDPLLAQFNPVDFDAKEWVRIAKNAGMKYIVITSKHHDGFALYPSKQSQWNVAYTPFKRDILKELSQECKKAGIVFCTYHSIMDWHHPDYAPRRPWDLRSEIPTNMDRYTAYMKAQLKEIVENYDPGIMWFDGEWEDTWNHARGVDLYQYVRSLKPSILVNNRVDKGRAGMAGMTVGDHLGDFGTPEQEIPPNGFPGADWESCMTMNDTWGFHQNDHNWKSAETLIQNLVDCASKGGNYLLNVGPTALGKIPPESVVRLRAVGDWLKVNGESIYNSQASPFSKPLKWGRVTSKPGKLYLHVFDTKATDLLLPGFTADVKRFHSLDPKGGQLRAVPSPEGLVIQLPARTNALVPVVVLEYSGAPTIVASSFKPDANGSFLLKSVDADTTGKMARYEKDKDCIGYWTDASDVVSWPVEFPKAGKYAVEMEIACEPGQEGSAFEVLCGDAKVSYTVPVTKSWNDFLTVKVGEFGVPSARRATISVKPLKIAKGALMNLRSVRLRPI